jgi:tetratricopeptide (TPR) repeat protein
MKKNLILAMLTSILIQSVVLAGGSSDEVRISDDQIIKQQAIIFYQNSNYKRALEYFLSINNQNLPDDVLLLMSNCFDSLGDSENAFSYLKKAVVVNKKNPDLYYNLGVLYFNKANYSVALLFFQQATKLNNRFYQAEYNLANCYFNLNNYKNSIRYYKKAIYLNPKLSDAYYNLSVAYNLMGNKKEAKVYNDMYNQLEKANNQ